MKKCTKCSVIKLLTEFNRDKTNKDGLQYKCKECSKKYSKSNYNPNYKSPNQTKETKKQTMVKFKSNNPNYDLNRFANNLEFKIKNNLRTSFTRHNKFQFNDDESVESILGCSINTFITYIESLMSVGMSWENKGEWELDHIIPLKTSNNRKEYIQLNHYKNIKPLWKSEHKKKTIKEYTM